MTAFLYEYNIHMVMLLGTTIITVLWN